MRIAVIPNLTKKDSYEVTLSIYKGLLELGVECCFENAYSESFSACEKALFLPSGLVYSSSDIVIAVGGDGSILHAAKKAALNRKPILGVNTGFLAFMAGLEKNELDYLSLLVSGGYSLEKRLLLKTELFEDGEPRGVNYCVNDAVFARGARINPTKLIVECDGNRVNEYRADGIVISTPTGSTAYSLSAGGSVADPTALCILMTPISSHSLMSRPLIFRSDSVLSVSPLHGTNNDVYLSCDGEDAVMMSGKSRAVVSKADFSVDFVKLKSYTFWDTLYTKLFKN